MISNVMIALLNGIVIGTSRAINGRLSTAIGAFKASLWNHIVGLMFLTLIILASEGVRIEFAAQLPWFAYIGGAFGALFVAVNCYVFPRIGAMNTVLWVISGQMISAVLIDAHNQGSNLTWVQCLGVSLILGGIYMARSHEQKHNKRRVDIAKDTTK